MKKTKEETKKLSKVAKGKKKEETKTEDKMVKEKKSATKSYILSLNKIKKNQKPKNP